MNDFERELLGLPKKQEGNINVLSLLASTNPKKSQPPQPVKSKPIEEEHELFKMPEDQSKKKLKNIVQEARMTPQQLRFKKNMEALKQKQKKAPKAASSGPNFISFKAAQQEKLPKAIEKQHQTKKPEKTEISKQNREALRAEKQKRQIARQKERASENQKNKQKQIRDQKQKERQKERQRQRDKERERERDSQKQKERQKRRQLEKRKLRKERQERERQRTREKHKKKNRYSDSEEQDQLDDFIVDDEEDNYDWRREVKKVTGKDFTDPKFRKLDREKIEQSSSNRIFSEEKISAYFGKKEEEQDMRKQLELLRRKKNRN